MDGGIGVAALAGDYDYEIGASSGSGGAAAAVEFDVSAQTGFPIAPASVPLVGLARVGLSTLLLFADAASDGTVPWDEAFDEGLTELYMSAGIGYRFMDHLMGSLMYRFTAAQLDAWTDLRDNAEWEDFSNAGPELRVSFIY